VLRAESTIRCVGGELGSLPSGGVNEAPTTKAERFSPWS